MTSRARAGRIVGQGKYELLSPIGNGAMGTVWLARHVALDRIVAIKMLNMVTSASSEARHRFMSEARSASLLRHANSVRVLDYAAEPDECFLVMEFLEGRTLSDVLAEQSPLPPRRAIAIAVQTLAAVAEAHEFGIVHRDLKPGNIMLVPWMDDDGRETEMVKVLDFGIAELMRPGRGASGEVAGTPEYMSPEQAQGLEVDPRSDVYAVGVLLYQMLTGALPFQAASALDIMLAHVNQAPIALTAKDDKLSPELERVVMRALSKHPAERFAGARAMRTALLELAESTGLRAESSPRMRPVAATPISDGTGPQAAVPQTIIVQRSRWPAVIVLALLALGVGVALVLTREDTPIIRNEVALALPAVPVPPAPALAPAAEPVVEHATEIVAADAAPQTPDTGPETVPDTAPGPDSVPTPDTTIARAEPPRPPTPTPVRVAQVDRPAPRETPVVTTAEPRVIEPAPAPERPVEVAATIVTPPETQPEKLEPKPETKPEPVRVAPRPALAAKVAIRDLVVKGSLPRSAVQRALEATRGALEQCYRVAAQGIGQDLGGTLYASVVIDVDGQATSVDVAPFGLAGFSACARGVLGRARTRERPDTGTALANFTLAISPLPPESP